MGKQILRGNITKPHLRKVIRTPVEDPTGRYSRLTHGDPLVKVRNPLVAAIEQSIHTMSERRNKPHG